MRNTGPISQPCSGGLSPAALTTMSPSCANLAHLYTCSGGSPTPAPTLSAAGACTQNPSRVPERSQTGTNYWCLHLETLEAAGCMRGSSRWLRPSTSLTKRHPGSSASEQAAFQYYSNND